MLLIVLTLSLLQFSGKGAVKTDSIRNAQFRELSLQESIHEDKDESIRGSVRPETSGSIRESVRPQRGSIRVNVRLETRPETSGSIRGNVTLQSGSIRGSVRPENGSISGSIRPESGTISGSIRPESGTISGSIRPENGSISGSIRPESGTISGSIRPESGTISGSIRPESGSISGSIRPESGSIKENVGRQNGAKKHGSGDEQTRGRQAAGTGRRQSRSRERNTDQRRSRSRSGGSTRRNQAGRGTSHAGTSTSSVSTNIMKEDEVPQQYSIGISVMRYDGGIVNLIKSDTKLLIETVLRDYYKIESEYIEHGKLKINGDIFQINNYLNDLSRRDNRWYMPGQPQQRHHLFRPIFDGHVMVPLVNNDGVELARYHFNHYGLNVYKKEVKTNFLVEEDSKGDFKYITLEKDLVRGSYEKKFFEPNLLTRKITIKELNRIALKDVINEREYSANGDFMCRHFAYEFVLSIVEEPDALMYDDRRWPRPLTNYDNYVTRYYDLGVTAFAKSVQNFYYRRPPRH